MTATATVEHADYYRMAGTHDDIEGMTLRQALATLREDGRAAFGNIGTLTADLSDGTFLSVELQDCSDGSKLMSSQRIVRRAFEPRMDTDSIVRVYNW